MASTAGQSPGFMGRISSTGREYACGVERWATFDCYGTLVDWNTGIRTGIEAVFGARDEDELLGRYHELEPAVQAECPGCSYREVLTVTLERLAEEQGLQLPEGEGSTLARALPGWPVFADVRPA